MKEPVIVDSACLISLERINFLDLLPALFDPIIAPPEAQRELGKTLSWLRIETPANQTFVVTVVGGAFTKLSFRSKFHAEFGTNH